MKRRRGLDDVTKWRVKMLAKFGGFSVSAIARETGASENQVHYALHQEKLKLRDWRELVSTEAKNHARSISRSVKKRRRA